MCSSDLGLFVVWDEPAMGVVDQLRVTGQRVPLTTIDLGGAAAMELATGEYLVGIGAQRPWEQGVAQATAAILALIGHELPTWVALPALPVTRDTVLDAYRAVWRREPPAALQQLAKLDQRHRLLSREFGIVDLRLPDKLYLRKRTGDNAPSGPA